MYLKSFTLVEDFPSNKYPLSLPVFKNLQQIFFNSPITILMGDNGSGKSTLIKLIAEKLEAIKLTETKNDMVQDEAIIQASRYTKIGMVSKPKRKLLFQGEVFTHYLHQITSLKEEASQELLEIEDKYTDRSLYSKSLAKMPHERSLYELNNLYENDLNILSHGESFLEFFSKRISKDGLFIIDEPEAALSMENQLVFLNIISESIKNNSQVIISTHSPIIAAYPNAQILEIKDDRILQVPYNEVRSINFLKSFLENPKGYIRFLE